MLLSFAVAAAITHDALPDIFGRWDSGWYVIVARDGYYHYIPVSETGEAKASALAFFPLFPLLMRWFSAVTSLGYLTSGVLLANAFGGAAMTALWRFTRSLTSSDVADRTVVLASFFPAAFVLSMAYTESLALLLAVGCIAALLRQHWLLAGVLAGVASGVRLSGLALGAACLWMAIDAIRQRREWRALVAPALAPIGTIAFFGFLHYRVGSFWAVVRVEREGWRQRMDGGVVHEIIHLFDHPYGRIDWQLALAGLVFIIITGWLLWRWRPPGTFGVLAVFVVATLLPTLLSSELGPRPRFALAAFPLFIALARKLQGIAFAVVVATSGALLAAHAVLTTATDIAIP